MGAVNRPGKLRVAVLGGGCAGVTAAFRLSDTPEKRARFTVTIYQQGFRLGGKGATGRNPAAGLRIEEHGLHVWMGFYHHAFALVRDAYMAWDAPAGAPYRRVEEVFAPCSRVSFVDHDDAGAIDPWILDLPPRPGRPWDHASTSIPDAAAVVALASWAARMAWDAASWTARAPTRAGRRAWLLSRLLAAAARGLAVDVLPAGPEGFDRIDSYDLRAWLIRHGAAPEVADAPPIRAFYDLAFAYPGGRSGPGLGQVAAGAALRSLIRMLFTYRGAPFWKMRLGMGDTVFAPLLGVLEQRGVRVAWFHRLERMRVERGAVAAIDFTRQARTRGDYRPFVHVRGHPCWPDTPQWDQLEDGDAARRRGDDYEASTCSWGEPLRLRRGHDYDIAILAIPVDAHHRVAADLIAASPAWGAMVANTHTVATAAMQMWLTAPLAALGLRGAPAIITGFEAPFRSMADLGEVLPAEDWQGEAQPRGLLYLCDVWPDDGPPAPHDISTLLTEVSRRLDRLLELFPGAARHGSFDHSLLVASCTDDPAQRLAQQYFRINSDLSQRYILTLPGTTKHRLAPDDAGFDGLFLAGDWTRTSINGGSVEAAVESGQLAADAIVARHG